MSDADRLLRQIGNVMTPRAAARKAKSGKVKVKVTKGNRYGEGKGLCTVWMTEKKPYIPGVSYGISRVRASAVGTYPCADARKIATSLRKKRGAKKRGKK
jgi:hypothetical protein